MAPTVTFKYKNHRGIVAERTVTVHDVRYVREPGYGYEAGMFLHGHCHTKNERRSFAFANMLPPESAGGWNHYYLFSFN